MTTPASLQALGQLQAIRQLQQLNSSSTSFVESPFSTVLATTLENQLGSVANFMQQNNSLFLQQSFLPTPTVGTVSPSGTNAPEDVKEIIHAASQKYNVPVRLIEAVIKQESGFRKDAVSSAGASGYMQLMPATAKYLGVTDIFNAEQNIMGGTKYLRQMLDKFGQNIELALAAYNAGPGNVDKYNGIPPFKETTNYVKKVTATYYA
ncbi:lytic transglycosylase domain-containing protein [Mangrovibacillus cuniculi]|uniref:Lytic transglycosylase domain-containing protein n=1 Tax=Mangrovibacillus cuniculi TaxID=2593652 RepID=A0A7S8C9Y4_9BACI|nr:lytic transglycosylase domain-containing protein [Mangrovibacillus cuniculi]QPC46083.1 lytic transglycosylase domain-containing protein [Mangrovibacillus cuniculi]